MKLACIGFTKKGCELEKRIVELFCEGEDHADGYALSSLAVQFSLHETTSLTEFCKMGFSEYDGLIFVGACGIAVRGIAPFLKSKHVDPAVVVVDELGTYSISLLSGHVGEANRLAETIAQKIGAMPVITTATDLNHRFAVDCWAKEQDLVCQNPSAVKTVSSALLDGKTVWFDSDPEFLILGELPQGIEFSTHGELGICVSVQKRKPFAQTLHLVPKQVILGIGCKKGVSKAQIEHAVLSTMRCFHLFLESIQKVCSIDRKKEEAGLIEFCEEQDIPLVCFSAEELLAVKGDFTASSFVASVTGVENVCERAAVLGSHLGELVVTKQTYDGVTVAVAIEPKTYLFSSGGEE
jgi:cobalt-precorrin 5A hydrolase